MVPTEMKSIELFISHEVEVAILDEPGEEQAPFVKKIIKNTALCPEGTHLRIYFDDHYFFAVPLTASISMDGIQWTAYDQDANLYYVIRKECRTHD